MIRNQINRKAVPGFVSRHHLSVLWQFCLKSCYSSSSRSAPHTVHFPVASYLWVIVSISSSSVPLHTEQTRLLSPSSLQVAGFVTFHSLYLCGSVSIYFTSTSPHLLHFLSLLPYSVQVACFVIFHLLYL